MKKKFLIFFTNFLLFFFLFSNVSAQSQNPKEFIQEIVDDAKKILVDTNSPEYKTQKLIEIAKAKVDIKGIGLYSLGSYRKNVFNCVLQRELYKIFVL